MNVKIDLERLYEAYKKCNKVSTDSRSIGTGDMFFALKGENYDGNLYLRQAFIGGAIYAVTDNPDFVSKDERIIVVPNVLEALQGLAQYHRRQLNIPIIAVTGSNGKTTTKELTAGVLSAKYKVTYTQGNLNNHIGVPLTLLSIPSDAEMAVVEMGANHQGEIRDLCKIAEPDFGLITNIGKAHLEGFGGEEGVKKGKSELYEWLSENNGTAFADFSQDKIRTALVERRVKNVIFYNDSNIKLQPYINGEFLSVKVESSVYQGSINTHLVGLYNVANIGVAFAVGLHFGVQIWDIVSVLENYTPTNNRSQLIEKDDCRFVMDAYNANPTSMQHALESFEKLNATPKGIMLGEMLELGESSEKEHAFIASLTEKMDLEFRAFIGKCFENVPLPKNALHFKDVFEAKKWWNSNEKVNFTVLVKGSRGNRLEKLIE